MPLEVSEAADGFEARAGMAVAPAPAATIPAPVICRKLRRPILDSSGPMGSVLRLLSRRQRRPLEQVPPVTEDCRRRSRYVGWHALLLRGNDMRAIRGGAAPV